MTRWGGSRGGLGTGVRALLGPGGCRVSRVVAFLAAGSSESRLNEDGWTGDCPLSGPQVAANHALTVDQVPIPSPQKLGQLVLVEGLDGRHRLALQDRLEHRRIAQQPIHFFRLPRIWIQLM